MGLDLRSRGAAVAGVVTALTVLGTSPALADIYWTQYGGSISSSNLDGQDVVELIPEAGPNLSQVSVGPDGHLYWSSYDSNQIGRSNLDGSSAQSDWLQASEPTGVVVTKSYIYWAEDGNGRVSRAKIDGSDAEPDFLTGLFSPHNLAANSTYLYVADTAANRIVRVPLNGGPSKTLLTVDSPQGVAVNGSSIYWSNMRQGTIGRADIDGSNINDEFLAPGGWINGLAVDASHLYWSGYTSGYMGRADLDGSNANSQFVQTGGYSASVAVRGSAPTVTSVSPTKGPKSGGTEITIKGTGFYDTAKVTIGTQNCGSIKVSSPTTVTCKVPAGSGNQTVKVTNPDSQSATASVPFVYTTPTPPTPPKPAKQTPVKGCVLTPKKLPKHGTAQLLKAHCVTNAGQQVRVSVTNLATTRGDTRAYRVIRKSNGRVYVKTFGKRVALSVKWKAPAASGFTAYSIKHSYRV